MSVEELHKQLQRLKDFPQGWKASVLSFQAYTQASNNGEGLSDPTAFENILGHRLATLEEAIAALSAY
ncbi:hypothetical protein SAMN05421544_11619 [Riemerella columbipharyngis]|uniref:Uncharacterized protein n=1 Tax=Riemerella columbipharyngis TaxID=1071918 RepID=A0A1G7EJB5_9FLAO|nr:hypothetical protein SAMN05421544_11619 [Riemerella columbipharyngis]